MDVGYGSVVEGRGPWGKVAGHVKGEWVCMGVACAAEGKMCFDHCIVEPGLRG